MKERSEEVKRRPRRIKLGNSRASSHAEGLRIADEELNSLIKSKASKPAPKNKQGEENTILLKDRLAEIAIGSKSYAKEYRLKIIHRSLMRNIPLDAIAADLGVSIHTVMRDRGELRKRLQEEARNLDINHLIGDTMGFYNEIQSVSLALAGRAKAPMNMRLAAMRTALASKNDLHRFLSSSGVYDVLRYQAAEKDGQTDIEKLVAITEAFLKDDGESTTVEDLQSIINNNEEDDDQQEIQVL